MGAERHWTSRKYMMSNYFIIVPLLFIGLVNGLPITEDEYDADTWVPWLERPMIKVPNQGFLPNYQGDVNMQKRLMVPMPKMKLPDLSKLRLQDSFIAILAYANFHLNKLKNSSANDFKNSVKTKRF